MGGLWEHVVSIRMSFGSGRFVSLSRPRRSRVAACRSTCSPGSTSVTTRLRAWYVRLLGSEPTFIASDKEAVWELAEHRSLFIEEHAEHAGHAVQTVFVDDLDVLVAEIAERGIEPDKRETYPNGVRKALYRDPDGNDWVRRRATLGGSAAAP